MPVTIASNGSPSQLADLIWAPKEGETYVLVGSFPASKGRANPKAPVSHFTLDCTQATFTGPQYWQNVTGLEIIGGTFNAGLRIDYGNEISLLGSRFDASGIMISTGSSVSIKSCSFKGGGGCAIGLQKVVGVLSDHNTFAAMTGDCHQFTGCSDVTVQNCVCSGGLPAVGAHPDFVQNTYLAGFPATGFLIQDNDISGPTQGIFLPGGVVGIVKRNRIATDLANGIAVGSGSKVVMVGNKLSGAAQYQTYPGGEFTWGGGNLIGGKAKDAPIALDPVAMAAKLDAVAAAVAGHSDPLALAVLSILGN